LHSTLPTRQEGPLTPRSKEPLIIRIDDVDYDLVRPEELKVKQLAILGPIVMQAQREVDSLRWGPAATKVLKTIARRLPDEVLERLSERQQARIVEAWANIFHAYVNERTRQGR
jgi:hypothetical protein